jgi:peptidoglycan/LPS O-acetylase OafA/YrhL/predicted O-methyltransferase YrrM
MRLDHLSDTGRARNNFDLLRLLAATFVVFEHSFALLKIPAPFPLIEGMSWGFVGVLIFFSISGFLVSRSWSRNPHVAAFVIKRALRIMPALIVVLLVSALILGPLVATEPLRAYFDDPGAKAYIVNNTMMQSDYDLPSVFSHNIYPLAVNGSLWTLPLEVKAYVFLALIGLIGLLARFRIAMIGLAALTLLTCVNTLRSSIPGANHFVASLVDIQANPELVYLTKLGMYTVYADMFAAFVIAATLFSLRRWIVMRWEFAALAVAAFGITIAVGGSAPLIGAVALGPYIVLYLAYRTTTFFRLPNRFGDYSYGIYIYAFPVQQTISSLLHMTSGWLMFAVAMPITSVAAVLSWHWIERPALNIKSRIVGAEAPAGADVAKSELGPNPSSAILTDIKQSNEGVPLLFPPGHFYSPMYDPQELVVNRALIWPSKPRPTLDLDWHDEKQLDLCNRIFAAQEPLALRREPSEDPTEYWCGNDQYPPLDAWVLAAMLRHLRPTRMIEIGSGFSSLVTARVNREEFAHSMHFTCIEPYPRNFLTAGVGGISELRQELIQDSPLDLFTELTDSDILFIDTSHTVKTGGDVTWIFHEIIPRLQAGVVVHVHDFFLPYEYPENWVMEGRGWNETYLVRSFLGYNSSFEVLWATQYMLERYPDSIARAFRPDDDSIARAGGSLWFQRIR